jgi:aminoglycoside phosphotransferase (APT) family kinase protein
VDGDDALMSAEAARTALRDVGLEAETVEPILGGWAYWTFDVDGRWIARFARTPEVGHATHRELALLPRLAEHVSYAVPTPSHHGVHQHLPFFAYPKVAGRSMQRADATPAFLGALGEMLRELHSFPRDEAVVLLGTGAPARSWPQHFERLWPIVETVALPAMDRDLADRVRTEFANLLAAIVGVEQCLMHNDLGLVHVIVDATTTPPHPVGIIDFEDAQIGDPAADLMPIWFLLGDDAFDMASAGRDLGANVYERMWHYSWMAAVHAIIYGVRSHDDGIVADGLAGVRKRISRVGRAARA